MELLTQSEIAAAPDLGHRLRRLRWFRQSFRRSAAALGSRYGLVVHVNDEILARVFLDWAEALERMKGFAAVNRADFIKFAGGLVLRELVRAHPAEVRLQQTARQVPVPDIVAFWPEGFLYTNYCISVVSAVHQEEFGSPLPLSECVDDLRTWWSFRENTQEMPSYAVAFLDRFFGIEPNWLMPDQPESRSGMAETLRLPKH